MLPGPSLPRTALLGYGQWGKNLARVLYDLGALTHVVKRSAEGLSEIAHRFPGVKTFCDPAPIWQDSSIRAVVIATPAPTHYTLVRNALTSGKDVLVEKPLTLSASQGKALEDLAQKHGRILMVGHIAEHHPAFAALKSQLPRGGPLISLHASRLNARPSRSHESVLWALAPHDVGMILSLVGSSPVSVHAQFPTPDTAHLTLHFGGGEKNPIEAQISCAWGHPFKETRLVVTATEGQWVLDDLKDWPEKLVYTPHSSGAAEPVSLIAEEPLRIECRRFLDHVSQRSAPETGAAQAIAGLEILETAEKSAAI